MTTVVKRRGGTTGEHSSFVGASREITVDTDKKTIVVHDGVTPGGFPLAREDMSNVTQKAFFYGLKLDDEENNITIEEGGETHKAEDFVDWFIVGMAMNFTIDENGHLLMQF